MISQVTFWVQHGETTDPLETFIMLAENLPNYAEGLEGTEVTETDFIVDVTPPKVKDDVDSIIATLDKSNPWYTATHLSNHDDSDAMLVSTAEDGLVLNLVNEDGYQWSDRAKDWRSIV